MTTTALAWDNQALVPIPIGNLDDYVTAIQKYPFLSIEEERELARRFCEQGDLDAAGKLVLSHLRLVVATARTVINYGIPFADLIQEGNIALMKAVKRYDHTRAVRFATYATYWIKSEIYDYIIKNIRIVKFATTKAHRKLFYNLRSMKDDNQRALTTLETEKVAKELEVRPADVVEMERRFSGGDVEIMDNDPFQSPYGNPLHDMMESEQREAVTNALGKLNDRERRVIETRLLADEPLKLQELGIELGVSTERARQIEVAALKKLRTALSDFAS